MIRTSILFSLVLVSTGLVLLYYALGLEYRKERISEIGFFALSGITAMIFGLGLAQWKQIVTQPKSYMKQILIVGLPFGIAMSIFNILLEGIRRIDTLILGAIFSTLGFGTFFIFGMKLLAKLSGVVEK